MMDFDKESEKITKNLGAAILNVPAVRFYIAIQLQKAYEQGMLDMLSKDAKAVIKKTE